MVIRPVISSVIRPVIHPVIGQGGGLDITLPFPVSHRWRVDSGVSVTGTSVTAWEDIIDGQTLLQAVGANQPIFTLNSINGKPAIHFTGDKFMRMVMNDAIRTMPDGNNTVLSVTESLITGFDAQVYLGGVSTFNNMRWGHRVTSGFLAACNASTFSNLTSNLNPTIGRVDCNVSRRTSSTLDYILNGNLFTANIATNVNFNAGATFELGAQSGSGTPFFAQVKIAEIVLCDYALSIAQINDWHKYVNAYYGKNIPILTEPSQVTNLALNTPTTTGGELTWTLPNNGGTPIISQRIERSPTVQNMWTALDSNIANNATSYTDTTAEELTTYDYRHRSNNAIGNSPYSNIITVTTLIEPLPFAHNNRWRADGGVSVTGSSTTAWADLIANQTLLQSIGARQPIFTPTSINGKPAIHFTGDKFMSMEMIDAIRNMANSDNTILSVTESLITGFTAQAYLGGTRAADGELRWGHRVSGGFNAVTNASTFSNLVSNQSPTIGRVDSNVSRRVGNKLDYVLNGNLFTANIAVSPNFAVGARFDVGAQGISPNPFFAQVKVAEIVLCDYALSDNDIDDWNAYVNQHYGTNIT